MAEQPAAAVTLDTSDSPIALPKRHDKRAITTGHLGSGQIKGVAGQQKLVEGVSRNAGVAVNKALETKIWRCISIRKARDLMDFQGKECYISREDKP
jgi:hypothetical protein